MGEALNRRTFLTAGPVAALAGAVAAGAGVARSGVAGTPAGASTEDDSTPTGDDGSLDDWDAVRAQFDLDPDIAHFAAFVLAGHVAPVREAIAHWRRRLDTDPESAVFEGFERLAAAREVAATYLGVDPDEIALTDSTTMGLGLTYNGTRLERGDHVLTTEHDFYSTHESLRLAAARSGAEVERVALYDRATDASAGDIVSRLTEALRPTTRIVAVTWVHSGTGVKIPVNELADALAEHNDGRPPRERALLCVDAVHGFGAEDAGPPELGCDVFISGTHKWLFGPRGTGLVWVRSEVSDRFAPIIPPFSAAGLGSWISGIDEPGPFGEEASPGGAHSEEHRWAVAEAFDFHLAIGRDRVAARTRELATRLKRALAEVDGVEVVTPMSEELSAGIVCCEVRGRHPWETMTTLREDHLISASVTPYREQLMRFGTSIATTADDVDRAAAALASVAAP